MMKKNLVLKTLLECTKSWQKKIKTNIYKLLHISEAKVLTFIEDNPYFLDVLFY